MKKILHLIHRTWPYHGGSERYVWEHAKASKRWGFHSTIVATNAWDMSWLAGKKGKWLPAGKFTYDGIDIIRFPVFHPCCQNVFRALFRRLCSGGPDRFFYPNPFIPAFDKWIKSAQGFDLVHANAMPFLLHAGYRYAKHNKVPLVSVPHANIGSPKYRIEPLHYFAGDQPKVLQYSKLVVAQNLFEASVYTDECGVSKKNLIILGSGISPKEWENTNGSYARKYFSIPLGKKIVLSVTAHSFDKGSPTLLDASIKLWKKGLDFVLFLAGPILPDFQKYLDLKMHEVPQGKLIVTGYISEEIRKHLFSAAYLVAAPSRLDAFGIVLLDAWISGKPVIGCNAGGMPDLITDGSNGFLVDFADVKTLSKRLEELLLNKELAEKMGSKGKEKVLTSYTWKIITDRFYSKLKQVT